MKATIGTLQRKNGGWHWRHYVNGKQVSERIADATLKKTEAAEIANKKAAALVPMAPATADGRIPVVKFAESTYLPWCLEQKRPATYDGYRKIWKTHLRAHFAEVRLCDYQPHHATTFLTRLAKSGMGRHAVSHVRALMSGIFAHAVALGYVRMNPIHDARTLVKPRAPRATPHYTVPEMVAILAALQGEPRACVAMALAFVGLRRAEIMGLRWEDVDFAAGVLHIRRSAWRSHVGECKTEQSKRDVTFGPTVAAILESYRKHGTFASGYVLENEAAKPLELGIYAARVIRPTLAAVGLEWKGYYAGRRGAETEMARYTNGNSQITSHHFGHSKEVADKYYIKPLPDATHSAALAFDSALANEGQQGTDSL